MKSGSPTPHAATLTKAAAAGRGGLIIGQTLSFLGVAVLACGTAVLLSGSQWPGIDTLHVGWMTMTAGQTLLFLGVVTLVAAGLERTEAILRAELSATRDDLARLTEMHVAEPTDDSSTPSQRRAA